MCEIGLRQLPPGRVHKLLILLGCRCRRDAHDGVIAVCRNNLAGFLAQAVRSLPCLDGANTPPELLPEHNDAAIRRPQVFQAVDSNRPLTDLGLVVAGLPLARLVGISGELAGEHDVAIGPPCRRGAGVSLTCRNSMNMVLVSSMGTIQRLIIGPLKRCS